MLSLMFRAVPGRPLSMRVPKLSKTFVLLLLLLAGLGLAASSSADLLAGQPTVVVVAQDTWQGIAHLATEAQPYTDALGQERVLVELEPGRLGELVHHVHQVQGRRGGFFGFSSREEAEQFIARSRSAQAQAQAQTRVLTAYTIDNAVTVEPWLDAVQEVRIYDSISELSAFRNRHYQTFHGQAAAHRIRDNWQALAAGRTDVSVELFTDCMGCGIQPSVIMTVEGNALADEIVVIGGHLDSINWNDPTNPEQLAPGADDDASGIATITEIIAVALADGWKPERTVQFMAYAAEEVGLRGSRAIAEKYALEGVNVVGMLQLDMTNYRVGDSRDLRLITDHVDPALRDYFEALFDTYLAPRGLVRANMTCGYGCSDHAAWTEKGYPAMALFEAGNPGVGGLGGFPYIHGPNDTLANMGDTAAPSVPFAQLGLAFLAELGGTHGEIPSEPDIFDDRFEELP